MGGIEDERGASVKTAAAITTGGGFSTAFDLPDYQRSVVEAYHSGSVPKPPSGTYDASNRGYPDITLNGHNYQVFYSAQEDSITCPCKQGGVDGTSASAPASAGLLSLINGHLLAAGKTQLGFLNPLLYAAYEADPSIFNDIQSGDTKCTRDYCMQYGYEAGEGWDPIGGLGSINYEKLKQYVLRVKGLLPAPVHPVLPNAQDRWILVSVASVAAIAAIPVALRSQATQGTCESG